MAARLPSQKHGTRAQMEVREFADALEFGDVSEFGGVSEFRERL